MIRPRSSGQAYRVLSHYLQALEKEAEQLQEQLPVMQQDVEKLSLEAQRKDKVRVPQSATI